MISDPDYDDYDRRIATACGRYAEGRCPGCGEGLDDDDACPDCGRCWRLVGGVPQVAEEDLEEDHMDRADLVLRLGEAKVCIKDAGARLGAALVAAAYDRSDYTRDATRRAQEALRDALGFLEALAAAQGWS